MNPRLLIATANSHKIEEIRQILRGALPGEALEVLSAADFPRIEPPEETGETFEANALIKARAYADQTGLLTLADDSGLVVDALGGRPGVRSARYAATVPACIERVLREMRDVEPPRRTARFECHLALVDGHGAYGVRRGLVHGILTPAPRGSAGFGYDPIFELTEPEYQGRTMAELSAAEKNSLSHRGRALRAMAPVLTASLRAGRLTEQPESPATGR